MLGKTREHRRRSRRPWLRPAVLAAIGCVAAAAFAGSARAVGPSFMPSAGSPFPVGQEPHSISTADFNRDGRLDVATANISSDSVSVLLGNGAGGFAPAASVPVGDQPHSLAVGDFNRDLKLDLAVANSEDDTISILLGNGAGGFREAAGSPIAAGDGAWYVVTADLNGDKKLDLVVSNVKGSGPFGLGTSVSVLLGNGRGGFAEAPGSPLTAGLVPYGIAVSDLNRDGKLDLAVAGQFGGTVSIFLGNGAGGFNEAAGSPITLGRANSWIAAGDVDRDGKPDLVVANQGARNATAAEDITVLLGDGTGHFAEALTSPVDSGANGTTALVLSDLDGDGKLDIATTNIFASPEGQYSVSVLRGDGHAGFTAAAGSPIPVGTQPFALAHGDLNHDGKPDLAVANTGSNSVSVLLNTTPSARELLAPLRSEVAGAPIGAALKRELLTDLIVADAALRFPLTRPIACAALREFSADVERNAGTQGLSVTTAASWVTRAGEIADAAGCSTKS
jgi:FG-GAP-like repeat/FG-GAP repeat